MAIAANTFDDDAPVERQPGQLRRSKQGTPYVADPSGALVKSGERKGLAKMLAYGRPSGFGKAVEDGYNLAKWSERQVALGIGLDYADACAALAQSALATACAALAGLDRETKEFREAADGVITEAKRIAKSGIAAERGTHAHAIAEDDDEGRDWVVRAEAGEVLDVSHAAQQLLVNAWRTMLAVNGLEILATEFIVVHDGYRMAGTADRLARLTRDLHFVLVTGEKVTLAAGTVVVLDIKSGKHRTDNSGVAQYWQAYAVQIATYAGGVLYDPDTDTRTPYPWPVDQRWGLIAHLDVLGAIAGEGKCELILVDLEAGRHAAELCLAAKAWERRQDVFSTQQIAQLDAAPRAVAELGAPAAVPVPPAGAPPFVMVAPVVGVTFVDSYPHNLLALADLATGGETIAALLVRDPANPHDPNAVQVHVPVLGEYAMIGHLSRDNAARLAPLMDGGACFAAQLAGVRIVAGHTDRPGIDVAVTELASTPDATPACEATDGGDALARPDDESGLPPEANEPSVEATEPPPLAELHARLRRHPDIDEGFEVRDEVFARMAEHWIVLPAPAKAWAAALQTQAQQHGCGFHAKERHTLRRYELIRGLIVLAIAELDDDELVRLMVFAVTQDEAATFPAIKPGHALGALDAPEATQFALLCDQLAKQQVVLTFTDEGTPRFIPAAA
jgi:hypothetical protein